MGLSSRVRGNLVRKGFGVRRYRSIPAGAGEPPKDPTRSTLAPVYPRGCGGTSTVAFALTNAWGLSPRVRGNRKTSVSQSHNRRSIPAGAGEPFLRCGLSFATAVYPRGCGEPCLGSPSRLQVGVYPRGCGGKTLIQMLFW